MGKDDFLTPKAISNRIKAKGLQKLRWFCQMCNKQCRDENGFKCHVLSEGHQVQMKSFSSNKTGILERNSSEFKSSFLQILSRYGSKRVNVQQIYRELISDRNHMHMSGTRWTSLKEFSKGLGRDGLAVFEEDEDGYYLTYVDNSPKELARRRALEKIKSEEKVFGAREKQLLQEQIIKGEEGKSDDKNSQEIQELKRSQDDKKIEGKIITKKQKITPKIQFDE
jgi:DNA/RNA-binding protein KIN17